VSTDLFKLLVIETFLQSARRIFRYQRQIDWLARFDLLLERTLNAIARTMRVTFADHQSGHPRSSIMAMDVQNEIRGISNVDTH
jgi:hypothetical protein